MNFTQSTNFILKKHYSTLRNLENTYKNLRSRKYKTYRLLKITYKNKRKHLLNELDSGSETWYTIQQVELLDQIES